jgi:hypothetical protein
MMMMMINHPEQSPVSPEQCLASSSSSSSSSFAYHDSLVAQARHLNVSHAVS